MEKKIFMNVIWLVLALICLGYYIMCASYAGIGSSFIFIWLIGAVFFGLVFTVRLLEIKGIIYVAKALKNMFYSCNGTWSITFCIC